jgi:RimJ/RimL family protein N-acetyltransferase
VLDDPVRHPFTGGAPSTESALRERFARQAAGRSPDGTQDRLNWLVRYCATREAVGILQATVSDHGGTAELAWVIAASRQGAGLATEAATTGRGGLHARGVPTFVAHVHPDHAASAAVTHRLGRRRPTEPLDDGEMRWVGSYAWRGA